MISSVRTVYVKLFLQEVRFVECRCHEVGTFAVVMRPKQDMLAFLRRGNKPTCSFDSRLFFMNRVGTFAANTNAILEVNLFLFMISSTF